MDYFGRHIITGAMILFLLLHLPLLLVLLPFLLLLLLFFFKQFIAKWMEIQIGSDVPMNCHHRGDPNHLP